MKFTETEYVADNSFSARANLFKKVPFRALTVGYTTNEGLVKTNEVRKK